MKRIAFSLVVIFILFCFSSCCSFYFLENEIENRDVIIQVPQSSLVAFMGGIENEHICMIPFKEKIELIKNTKLSYQFNATNITAFDSPIIELHSFSFINKKGDTIPYSLYYGTYHNGVCYPDSMFKIGALPFSYDIQKPKTGMYIVIETDKRYHKVKKKEVYVSFDITVNNQRITKKEIKYKRKLYVKRLI